VGLRDRRRGGDTVKFKMQEKLLSIGNDFWVEDEDGERVYKVDGKAIRFRETFVLEDTAGNEVARIKEKKLAIRDTMTIEVGGRQAKVHKRMIGIRDRYLVEFDDGEELKAKGNFVDHEYEIERDGDKVAEVSKKWFRVRDSYGVEMQPDQDAALVLAITVCIDAMAGIVD
jgi:uncharacterized protein YxjI